MSDFYSNDVQRGGVGYADPTGTPPNIMVGIKCGFCGADMSPQDMFCPSCGGRNQNFGSAPSGGQPNYGGQPAGGYSGQQSGYAPQNGGYGAPNAYQQQGYPPSQQNMYGQPVNGQPAPFNGSYGHQGSYGAPTGKVDLRKEQYQQPPVQQDMHGSTMGTYTRGSMDMGFDEMMVPPGQQISTPSTVNRSRSFGGLMPQNGALNGKRNKWIYFALCLFLGGVGAHHFYENKILRGLTWLLPEALFVPAVIESMVNAGDFFKTLIPFAILINIGRWIFNTIAAIIRLANTQGEEYDVR